MIDGYDDNFSTTAREAVERANVAEPNTYRTEVEAWESPTDKLHRIIAEKQDYILGLEAKLAKAESALRNEMFKHNSYGINKEISYKEAWEVLKQKVVSNREYYKDGSVCSLSESIHGEGLCEEFLKDMENIEYFIKEKG